MKQHRIWCMALTLTAAIALSGCGVELLTATAIQGELQAQQAQQLTRHIDHAESQSAIISAQQAVDVYRAEKGTNPPSLEALVPEYLGSVPTGANGGPLGYDPATGRVLAQPRATPTGPTPADYTAMDRIRAAINRYGTDTGYYPNTLGDLAPYYLPTVPVTAAGQPFIYNNQNGEVRHPLAGANAGTGTRRNMPAGGGGPLGETVGAMGVQQELNRQSPAGANAAGNRARQNSRGAGSGHNDNLNQTMDNLGL